MWSWNLGGESSLKFEESFRSTIKCGREMDNDYGVE